MKYPCLVPKKYCKMNIQLKFEQEGLNEYGEPLPDVVYTGKCNYQDKAKTVFTADKKLIQITGRTLFPGDICPQLPVISGGEADILGEKVAHKRVLLINGKILVIGKKAVQFGTDAKAVKRRILQGMKARNPDGSVNYTEVLLV